MPPISARIGKSARTSSEAVVAISAAADELPDVLLGAASFSAIRSRTSSSSPGSCRRCDDLLEVALDEDPHRLGARDAADIM